MKRYSVLAAFVALLVGLFIGSQSNPSQRSVASDPNKPALAEFTFDEPCDKCECPTIDVSSFAIKSELADLRKEMFAELEKRLPLPVVVKSRPVVSSSPAVSSSYKARWQNYDGKDRLQHAREDHGIDTSKYSTSNVLKLMDADHDKYGGGAHDAIKASRTSTVTRTRSTASSCPGGVCPTVPSQSYNRPIFRLFRR